MFLGVFPICEIACRAIHTEGLERPLEGKVEPEALAQEDVSQQPPEERVVRTVLERQALAVVDVHDQFGRQLLAEHLGWCRPFDLPNGLVARLWRGSDDPLPWQAPLAEVDEHVPDGLEVVAAALLDAPMRVDRGVARCAREAQARAERNVGLLIVALAQAEIDHVQVVDLRLDAPHEVFGLDVAVDDAFGVQVLGAADELIRHKGGSPRGELVLAHLHTVLQGSAKQLHDHAMVAPLAAEVKAFGKTLRLHRLPHETHDRRFLLELLGAGAHGLELHSDLLPGLGINAMVHLTEAARAQSLVDLEAAAGDSLRRLRARGGDRGGALRRHAPQRPLALR
mmetsp:Transcript_104276/g.301674  ORF Transcript_104276/g.301674 Transcript_104276/m.301674 type:complete len:339 (-) Transcript_104276:108-1124(-)